MDHNQTELLTDVLQETLCLPAVIAQAGERARDRFIGFFTANIRTAVSHDILELSARVLAHLA